MSGNIECVLELLEKLVAFPSISSTSNKSIIDFIESYLSQHGVIVHRTVTTDGEKHNLVATIGDPNIPGIVLSGHTDVVPVAGQDWIRDPFKLYLEDDKAFGRGTVDMKGFLACILATVPEWTASGRTTPLHLTFTHDEEVGCLGAQQTVDTLLDQVNLPIAAIIGEPTRLKALSRHKGCTGLITEFKGVACHSSRPQAGANAIYAAAKLVSSLERIQSTLSAQSDPDLAHFEKPYTTLNVGTIKGGNGRNLVPSSCQIEWDIRETRAGDMDFILEQVDQISLDELQSNSDPDGIATGFETTRIFSVKVLFGHSGDDAVSLVQNLTGSNEVLSADFATEAGFFDTAKVPSVVCGPGDIAQAHTADEWIEISELKLCLRMRNVYEILESRYDMPIERPRLLHLAGHHPYEY